MSVEPAPVQLEPIQIENFEQMVYGRQHEAAVQELFSIIYRLKCGHGFMYWGPEPKIESLYTRVASAIGALLADPQLALSHEGFLRIMNDHATLHGIFRASVYGNMDYVMRLFGGTQADESGQTKLQFRGDQNVGKFLLSWSLESEVEIDWDYMTRTIPAWAVPAMYGVLAVGGVHTEKAYNRKVEMLKNWRYLERTELPLASMAAAGDTYMHCSYVDYPEKHEVKKAINRQLRALVSSLLRVEERRVVARKERPTIVVPVEWFNSAHAMFRCYCPAIRQLRERFNMVLVCRDSEVDAEAKGEFDKVVTLPTDRVAVSDMIKLVQDENPDIIFYPSLGMTAWWVAISNFRLAPIQIMAPGHPATSYSDAIDYIVSDGDLYGDEAKYQEKCVHLPIGGARYLPRTDFDKSKISRRGGGKTRFAIPAMVMKLAWPFLRVIQRLHAMDLDVEFHFFPNQVSTGHILIERELKSLIPGCVVHMRSTYQSYMEELAKCDVMLSTFPFGGTNSVMDCFLLGIPVVTWEGDEIHSRSDASMIRRVGLPEWMIAHSEEEYIAAAVRMATSTTDRENAKELLKEIDVEGEFYGEGSADVQGAWVKALWNIYQEKLDEQERRVVEGAGGGAGSRWGAFAGFAPALR